ncbi:MAG: tellurite resistance TerB family protein [Rickettsiales bacterium]|nr:tellurite resistance TerB family protein [Rickettsiales bacterium]
MLDPKSLLGNIDSNGLVGKMLGGMATKNFGAGLLTGGIATALLGKSDVVEGAAKLGGMALLGTLAYKAYNNYQQTKAVGGNASVVGSVKNAGQGMLGSAQGLLASLMAGQGAAAQPVAATPAALAAPQLNPDFALAVIRAMIGAAKADGHVDAAETDKIFGQIESQGLNAQEKSLLMREMANTPNIADIAAAAKTEEESAQIYLAATLVCDSQCAAEQAYLANLARSLKLDAQFTQALQQELLAMKQQQAA